MKILEVGMILSRKESKLLRETVSFIYDQGGRHTLNELRKRLENGSATNEDLELVKPITI